MNLISMTSLEKDYLKDLLNKEPTHRWMRAATVKRSQSPQHSGDRFVVAICVVCDQRNLLDKFLKHRNGLPSCSEYRMNKVLE